MSFKLIGNHLSPAEGEVVVRTYHCTNLSPVFALIGLKTNGYLTVTNKRVVYFALGASMFGAAGNSKLYSEVPIADVANLSLSQGTRFSFLRLLGGLLVGNIPAVIVTWILSGLMSALGGDGSENSPYLLRFWVFLQLTAAALLVLRSFSIQRESIGRFMFAASGLSLVLSVPALWLAHGGALHSRPPIYQTAMAILSVPLICYWFWCLYWFMRREYLTMTISSKSAQTTPIDLTGISFWGRRNLTARRASWMAPAVDAEAMFKDLGALVTDIQTLGDLGIKKWQQAEQDSVAEEANKQHRQAAWSRSTLRYALATILILGLLVGAESMWYASGAKRAVALKVRDDLASAKSAVIGDPTIRQWVPKMVAAAELAESAGEAAFVKKRYTDSTAHWKVAIGTYTSMTTAANGLKKAAALESEHKTVLGGVYVQETASERMKAANLMKDFDLLMDQHPNPNEPWILVAKSAGSAKELVGQEKWPQSSVAWAEARGNLPKAVQMMRADILVGQAETEIKKGNASGATSLLENALKEMPGYAPAVARKELAANMSEYAQWLSSDAEEGESDSAASAVTLTEQLDTKGGADWGAIKGYVEAARAMANRNEWDKCNEEWKKALARIPAVVLAVQMDTLETAARRGNWGTVSTLAGKILQGHPEQARAGELKKKADNIKSARAAEAAYRLAFARALEQEIASDHVKTGDLTDFIAHMNRYGKEEWDQVKDAISKAEGFKSNEQGSESAAEWARARAQFPGAIQRMRAELWVEQAEEELKSNNWAKVLVYAENALKAKPGHVRAKQLRDQADEIEAKRLREAK